MSQLYHQCHFQDAQTVSDAIRELIMSPGCRTRLHRRRSNNLVKADVCSKVLSPLTFILLAFGLALDPRQGTVLGPKHCPALIDLMLALSNVASSFVGLRLQSRVTRAGVSILLRERTSTTTATKVPSSCSEFCALP